MFIRWRKILGDIKNNKSRTFFAIIAMFIGIFGFSVVADSYSILLREMNKNYMNTVPASATLQTSPLTATQVKSIKNLPYIKGIEISQKAVGRVQVGTDEWKDIWLFVVGDFNNLQLDKFSHEAGKTVPDTGDILFERKALSVAKAHIGQNLNIRISGQKAETLKLTGTVHAPGLAPAWMEGFAYGYITPETFQLLGGRTENTELKILVAGDTMNKQHIRDTAYTLKAYLENAGVKVERIEIPEPGKHPHYDQMAALLFLMEIFGLLALVLSGVLVANMISSILEQQTRQIGIMKAVGAGSMQIFELYQGMVVAFAAIAVLAGIPSGILAGRAYAWLAATLLNFNIYSNSIPAYIFLIEIGIGVFIHMLTAAFPIIKSSRITVCEVLNDYGTNKVKYTIKDSRISPNLTNYLSRPFLLSLRNTFRRKGRLIFTILVMAAGGTGFIVAMNIYASMYSTVDDKINSISYDIQITFDKPQPVNSILSAVNDTPGAEKSEAWGGASASRIYKDGTMGNSFNIVAPPSNTKLMSAPPLSSGRWLNSNDSDSIVINQKLLSNEPDIKVGDQIQLRINQVTTHCTVVGVTAELAGQPGAYVNKEYLSELTGSENMARNAVVVTRFHNPSDQSEAARQLEHSLSGKGMYISSLTKISDYRKAVEDHLLIIATFLIIMSVLVLIVGGLGMSTTMSINTLERTREIGIMRAIGATPLSISGIITAEGIITGLLSCIISTVLSWPLSKFVSYNFGMIFFGTPLEFTESIKGLILWLIIVLLFSILSCFSPSRKGSSIPVKDALTYQ